MSGYAAFAGFYDALTRNVDYRGRAERLDVLIRRHCPQAELLLDLACGTGSLAVEFARLGYDVTGVDLSAEMLAQAAGKAGEAPRQILFLQQDMRRLDLYGTVDAAVCALDSLNHLPDRQSLALVFSRTALFLNPGGVFLFDLNTAYKHREVLGNNAFVLEEPEVYCVWRNTCRRQGGRVDIALDFFRPLGDGRYLRSAERFSERVFERDFVLRCLEGAGLRLLEVLDGDAFREPREDSQRLLYIAQKTPGHL